MVMVTSGDKGVVREAHRLIVTDHDKGSLSVRLRSGSSHMVTKKTSIWVLMCKEKREKISGGGNFHYTDPHNVHKALSAPNADGWRKAMDNEMDNLQVSSSLQACAMCAQCVHPLPQLGPTSQVQEQCF